MHQLKHVGLVWLIFLRRMPIRAPINVHLRESTRDLEKYKAVQIFLV